ncbi:MAG: phosphotransferase [Pseudomonadota bacterium]|nr:phosphotransferase [Pseudomonadota bacterium]
MNAWSTTRHLPAEPKSRHFPIIYSTLCVERLRQVIQKQYGLADLLEFTFYCRGVSDTYALYTPTRRYALKVYRTRWRSQQSILGELAALRHVGAKGVEVALPVARNDGDWITTIAAPEGQRCAVLFEWADGQAPQYTNADHMYRYGDLLARLHAAGEDLPTDIARPHLDGTYLLERPMHQIRRRLKHLPSIAAAVEALADRTRAHLERAAPRLNDSAFCHGDIWSNNARIEGERLVLFDFDFCGTGWQLFDLATFRWHTRSVGVELAAWRPFIAAYLKVRPAAAESLRCLGLFMILRHLWTAAHTIGRLPETGAYFLSEEDIENLVPFCEAIERTSPLDWTT